MKDRDYVFVTGAARSGTSLTTKVLNEHGLWVGEVNILNENTIIREQVVKRYLREIGADELGQHPLPDLVPPPAKFDIREKVDRYIDAQGGPKTVLYKGAKLCLMWKPWHQAFPGAKWIFVRRDPDDIADSCMRCAWMRTWERPGPWVTWAQEHVKRLEIMRANRVRVREIWPQKFIDGNTIELEGVMAWLNLEFDPKILEKTIDRTLFKSSAS